MQDEERPDLPFLRSVGLVMTCRCPASCPHCIVEAGPHRTEAIAVKDACAWIRQVALYRDGYVKVLCLTGGEPFNDIVVLRLISDFAASCGLLVSAVTNGYWAATLDQARRMLRDLPALRMLTIAPDSRWKKGIPRARIENAIRAAQECGLPLTVNVGCREEEEPGRREFLLHPVSTDPPALSCPGSSPTIFPDGWVMSCPGPLNDLRLSHPLVLGNLGKHSLREILDEAESNSILHAIRVWGPRRLAGMAREAGLGAHLPDRYPEGNVCTACCELMKIRELKNFFGTLAADEEFGRSVAFARLNRLGERRMVDLLPERVSPARSE